MPRKSMIVKMKLKSEKASKVYDKRKELRRIAKSLDSTAKQKLEAQLKLQKMHKGYIQVVNSCSVTGRSRGVWRKFNLCRHYLRKMAMAGLIPGIKKSSW